MRCRKPPSTPTRRASRLSGGRAALGFDDAFPAAVRAASKHVEGRRDEACTSGEPSRAPHEARAFCRDALEYLLDSDA